jgi:hypothetical protein
MILPVSGGPVKTTIEKIRRFVGLTGTVAATELAR